MLRQIFLMDSLFSLQGEVCQNPNSDKGSENWDPMASELVGPRGLDAADVGQGQIQNRQEHCCGAVDMAR